MKDSSSIVLNLTLAKKYFSIENPVGRVLTMTLHGQTRDYKVAIGLFVCTAVVYDQMRYIENMDLGYTKENMLMLGNVGQEPAKNKQETILDELRNHTQIISLTRSSETPDTRHRSNILVRTNDIAGSDPIIIKPIFVGYDFFETYRIPVVAGRTYDRERSDEPPSLDEVR